jgi:hypothetical protein
VFKADEKTLAQPFARAPADSAGFVHLSQPRRVLKGPTVVDRASFEQLPLLAPYSDNLARRVTVVGLSYASSIIGELVPKGLALSRVAVSGVARRKSVDVGQGFPNELAQSPEMSRQSASARILLATDVRARSSVRHDAGKSTESNPIASADFDRSNGCRERNAQPKRLSIRSKRAFSRLLETRRAEFSIDSAAMDDLGAAAEERSIRAAEDGIECRRRGKRLLGDEAESPDREQRVDARQRTTARRRGASRMIVDGLR